MECRLGEFDFGRISFSRAPPCAVHPARTILLAACLMPKNKVRDVHSRLLLLFSSDLNFMRSMSRSPPRNISSHCWSAAHPRPLSRRAKAARTAAAARTRARTSASWRRRRRARCGVAACFLRSRWPAPPLLAMPTHALFLSERYSYSLRLCCCARAAGVCQGDEDARARPPGGVLHGRQEPAVPHSRQDAQEGSPAAPRFPRRHARRAARHVRAPALANRCGSPRATLCSCRCASTRTKRATSSSSTAQM